MFPSNHGKSESEACNNKLALPTAKGTEQRPALEAVVDSSSDYLDVLLSSVKLLSATNSYMVINEQPGFICYD